jgi:hypothetical protein
MKVFRIALNATLVVLFALAWAIPAATAEHTTEEVVWEQPSISAPAIHWSPELAAHFPGCHATLPKGEIPASVIEVRDGFPARVSFADAMERAEDGDKTNLGKIVAQCR